MWLPQNGCFRHFLTGGGPTGPTSPTFSIYTPLFRNTGCNRKGGAGGALVPPSSKEWRNTTPYGTAEKALGRARPVWEYRTPHKGGECHSPPPKKCFEPLKRLRPT